VRRRKNLSKKRGIRRAAAPPNVVGAAAQSRRPFSLKGAFGFVARELLSKPIAVASAGAMDIEQPVFLETGKKRGLSMGHAPTLARKRPSRA
jgi:hypothetical protein